MRLRLDDLADRMIQLEREARRRSRLRASDGIGRVERAAYIVFDRQHLAYLNAVEKMNCLYCGYANGVFAYLREIAGRTEQYWCPIRHARRLRSPHDHYQAFVEYGDAKGYHRRLPLLRARLATKGPRGDV